MTSKPLTILYVFQNVCSYLYDSASCLYGDHSNVYDDVCIICACSFEVKFG